MADVTFCVTFLFSSKIGFLRHNFGYRYVSKPIKGLKDVDFSLVSKRNLSEKNGLFGWRPGPDKVGPKSKTLSLLMSPTENPKPKTKKFIFNQNEQTSQIRRVFQQLFSSSGWQFMAKKVLAYM